MRICVASSWRCDRQPEVVAALRDIGHEVYDFRNPEPGEHGFSWSKIDPEWQSWTPDKFHNALDHPIAVKGYEYDLKALARCDAVVLVLPCGRSAHLEFGYAMGRGADGYILLAPGCEPELMYAMADEICINLPELLMKIGPARKEA